MMVKHMGWLATAATALLLSACGTTASARFYTLTSTSTAATAPPLNVTVVVGPVSIPGTVDRQEFVTTSGSNSVELHSFNLWAEPLADGVARSVAGDLSVLLGAPSVAVAPLANFTAAYRVTLRVQRFESTLNQSVTIDAVWVVRKDSGGASQSGRTVAHEAVAGEGFDALAAAHSRALAAVSADIAAAIRASAAGGS
jgi:uncharacterized lipoprotein YmbA